MHARSPELKIMYRFPPVVSTDFAVRDSVQLDQSTNTVFHVLTAVCKRVICRSILLDSDDLATVGEVCLKATVLVFLKRSA